MLLNLKLAKEGRLCKTKKSRFAPGFFNQQKT